MEAVETLDFEEGFVADEVGLPEGVSPAEVYGGRHYSSARPWKTRGDYVESGVFSVSMEWWERGNLLREDLELLYRAQAELEFDKDGLERQLRQVEGHLESLHEEIVELERE